MVARTEIIAIGFRLFQGWGNGWFLSGDTITEWPWVEINLSEMDAVLRVASGYIKGIALVEVHPYGQTPKLMMIHGTN